MERFKKLLVYADTDHRDITISRSIVLAIENEASLTLMEVIKPIPRGIGLMASGTDSEEIERLVVEDHRRKLLDRVSEFSDTAVPIDVIVCCGDPATEVTREVLRGGHDLVLKSADHFTKTDRYFGSVSRSLLRLCPSAVLLLRSTTHGDFDQVVAAIDIDATDDAHKELNQSIAELSLSIAQQDEAHLHLVAVWDHPMEAPFRQRVGDAVVDAAIEKHETAIRNEIVRLTKMRNLSDEFVKIHVRRGSASKAIRQVVEEVQADLLVMGTVCRTGIAGFLIGNTAETVLTEASCSVLALKPQGFVCPITVESESDGTMNHLSTKQ
jgi:nucleotide-binding universal stress UspA family protein